MPHRDRRHNRSIDDTLLYKLHAQTSPRSHPGLIEDDISRLSMRHEPRRSPQAGCRITVHTPQPPQDRLPVPARYQFRYRCRGGGVGRRCIRDRQGREPTQAWCRCKSSAPQGKRSCVSRGASGKPRLCVCARTLRVSACAQPLEWSRLSRRPRQHTCPLHAYYVLRSHRIEP